MSISRNMAELLCEMSHALNRGYVKGIGTALTGQTIPTSFETFVREVCVPAYQTKAATT